MIFATETMEEILQIKYKSQLKTINFPLILRIQGFKGSVNFVYALNNVDISCRKL